MGRRTVAGGATTPAPSHHLTLASLAYLALASGIMIWRGISVSPDYLLLLLIPVAIASGRFSRFVGDWVPFIAVFLGWEAMRGIAGRSGIPPHVGDIAGAERWTFGGHLPTSVLQSAIGGTGASGAVDYLATVVYFCHFAVPVAVGMILWLRSRVHFLRFATAMLGMSFAAFGVFLLLPTAPPWYAQDHAVLDGFRHVVGTTLPSLVSPYYSSLNPNPVAAMPSLHAAFPFLAFLMLRRVYPRGAWLALGWSVLVWFSIVYLGEHYVLDVVAGVVLATVATLVLENLVVPRVAALREQGGAPEPTPAPAGAGGLAPLPEPVGASASLAPRPAPVPGEPVP